MSPSTRRAWIEIIPRVYTGGMPTVALHPEGVDRNDYPVYIDLEEDNVALHPEGVDRNCN